MDPSDDTPRPRRRALVPRWVLVVVAVAVVAAAAGIAAVFLRRPETVTVPNVQGLDVSVARSRLGQVGLQLSYGDRRFSSTVPADGVIEQFPPAGGTLEYRGVVVVVVSAGSEEFSMPDVLGMTLQQARTELEDKGLVVDVESAVSPGASGTVLSSIPSPGTTVRTSDNVRITVAVSRESSTTLRPYTLEGKCFVLDAAEIPKASTAVSGTTDAPLEVARRVRSLLEASGATVTVTRSALDAPEAATEAQRITRATVTSCTAIVGLTAGVSADGIKVLSTPPVEGRTSFYIPSADLSRRIADAIRGSGVSAEVSTGEDAVLAAVASPGVRVMLGSVDSAQDRSAFADPGWADRIARAIYRGLGEAYGL